MKTILTIFVLTVFVGLGMNQNDAHAGHAAFMEASDSPSMDVLSDGSTVTFNSAYCQIDVGDTVGVDLISGDMGFAAGDNIVGCAVRSNGATPKKNKVNRTCTISCAGVGTRMLDITLTSASDKWKACHVDLTLTNGDMLGFNFIWNTCDP